jgi:phage major head subunit gpT-like protein
VAKMDNPLENRIQATERGLLETEEAWTLLGTSRRVKPLYY